MYGCSKLIQCEVYTCTQRHTALHTTNVVISTSILCFLSALVYHHIPYIYFRQVKNSLFRWQTTLIKNFLHENLKASMGVVYWDNKFFTHENHLVQNKSQWKKKRYSVVTTIILKSLLLSYIMSCCCDVLWFGMLHINLAQQMTQMLSSVEND